MDEQWMEEALDLARGAVGMASPNPMVGCVLVRAGEAVGRGTHIYDRLEHAEIAALGEAGHRARGATAYVTLEPCSHTGRTGPCAEALVRAGVERVVVATQDPNPLVSGRGLARLREAGIAVTLGVLEGPARELNDGFARFIRSGMPLVTLKAGVSLDGRIAPAGRAGTGTVYLTGAGSQTAVQRMRHAADAVLTGIGTVLADDPLLTDRSGLARRRSLLRVVMDSELRLPVDSRLVSSARGDVLVLTRDAKCARAEKLRAAGVEVEAVEAEAGEPWTARLDLRLALRRLAERRGIVNVLVEGGSRLNRALLQSELVDRLCLFYAPIFLGADGVPMLEGPGGLKPEVQRSKVNLLESDFCFDGLLRDPWR